MANTRKDNKNKIKDLLVSIPTSVKRRMLGSKRYKRMTGYWNNRKNFSFKPKRCPRKDK